ncbi:ribosome assembly RNA-binding protein YhbY [Anaerotalea alkaliphila]|uniref:Ribosome assembly RNA-binding protein YhbY n=1 Tax=Anaerotalea alkaliphila TaxID=2662126 RepID=A0A7X5KPD4_9FIRM|nr:ribosome assembly RNA-binding protein YhbY [Anaerotalea alkaliphila]NDL67922.1 ribosome assembly RNA-binding protein YhbY [Anaerotalea alkaliphila]
MTSKQRAYLRGLAQNIESIIQIGKAGVTPELTEAVSEALEKRELVKLTVLKNCMEDVDQAGEILAGRTRSILVATIGRRIVLYRPSKDNPVITLPK